MHIYFIGIGGVGLGPLSEIARGAGYTVSGSDTNDSLTTRELRGQGIDVLIYPQDGSHLRDLHAHRPIDWVVYTSSLPDDHAELRAARELGIKVSKRDELLSHIITEHDLKLIAVAGTHGKTTTTGMLVWTLQSLGIPVSYSVGTTLSFGPSGLFDSDSEYFVYECDEYDRNFLAFDSYLSLVTTVDHDHFDTYPTLESYNDAFKQFMNQSRTLLTWRELERVFGTDPRVRYADKPDSRLTLIGDLSRRNATLVLKGLSDVLPIPSGTIADALNRFPGTNRRFEKLADNLYSDYGHHPVEIAATLQLASELGQRIVLVYQPHQNSRQHEIQADYTPEVFTHADRIYWLPTYLTREDPAQAVLSSAELSAQLPANKVTAIELNDSLWTTLQKERESGALVLCMGAGTIDGWVRDHLTN